MGLVDLDFKPAVPVFDANVALGRRHDRRQSVDTAETTLAQMDRVGIERALVYTPHAAVYDSREGNNPLARIDPGYIQTHAAVRVQPHVR